MASPTEVWLKAAAKGDLAKIEEKLKDEGFTEINAVDAKNRKTALHLTAEKGFTDVCQALIEAKDRFTAVNAADKRGELVWPQVVALRQFNRKNDF